VTVGDDSFILVVQSSPREESVSSTAAGFVATTLEAEGFVIRYVDQRLLPFVPAGLSDDAYPAEIRATLTIAERASAIVLAVPVHRSAVAGVSRNLVELLRDGIEGKLVLPLVAAGSLRSTLAAQAFQADLLLNFRCEVLRAVLLSPDVDEADLKSRLITAVREFVARAGPAPRSHCLREATP
jgi:NAD(P)H-dependent FMN reductase